MEPEPNSAGGLVNFIGVCIALVVPTIITIKLWSRIGRDAFSVFRLEVSFYREASKHFPFVFMIQLLVVLSFSGLALILPRLIGDRMIQYSLAENEQSFPLIIALAINALAGTAVWLYVGARGFSERVPTSLKKGLLIWLAENLHILLGMLLFAVTFLCLNRVVDAIIAWGWPA
jgi:hypothetical protein